MLHAEDFLNLKFSFRWGERKQSPTECAAVAIEFMRIVKTAMPGFRTWRPVDDPAKKAVSLTKPALAKLFEAGQQQSEKHGTPLESHGFKVFLTTSSEALGFLGVYWHWGSVHRGQMNVAVIDAYLRAKPAKSAFRVNRCLKLCEQMVVLLQPDDGIVDNLSLFKLSQSPSSGWIVYVSHGEVPTLPKLPRGVEVRPFKKLGRFLLAADKSFPHVPPTNLKTLQTLGKIVDPLVKPRHG